MFCAAGGAKGARLFREKVSSGTLPSKSSITFEGLFSQYFFDTGITETSELVQPSYAVAQAPNVMAGGEVERYLALGLNSSEDGKNYRDPLNLLVVLDISGSMRSPFRGRRGRRRSSEGPADTTTPRTKMQIANEVLQEIVKVLTPEERLGIVLFDNRTEILQPFRDVSLIDREDLHERIGEIGARGGTNMEIGYSAALEMLSDHLEEVEGMSDPEADVGAKNNRIIFLTDAQPNSGAGPRTLIGMATSAAQRKIYTTFIGIGLDFNSGLVDQFSKVPGLNYFSVFSQRDFKKILNEDFNYITTPIVFNVVLFFESEGLEIEKVYGTPFADEASNVLMKIDTCCASAKDKRGVKGGIVLLKLKDKLTLNLEPSQVIRLTLRYDLPSGETTQVVYELDFAERVEESVQAGRIYENDGVRKAVLLAKFGTLMHDTIDAASNRSAAATADGEEEPRMHFGMWGMAPRRPARARPDPQCRLSEEAIANLKAFKTFFTAEAKVLADPSLIQELDALDRMIYQK